MNWFSCKMKMQIFFVSSSPLLHLINWVSKMHFRNNQELLRCEYDYVYKHQL